MRIARFHQHHQEQLPLDVTVMDYFKSRFGEAGEQEMYVQLLTYTFTSYHLVPPLICGPQPAARGPLRPDRKAAAAHDWHPLWRTEISRGICRDRLEEAAYPALG